MEPTSTGFRQGRHRYGFPTFPSALDTAVWGAGGCRACAAYGSGGWHPSGRGHQRDDTIKVHAIASLQSREVEIEKSRFYELGAQCALGADSIRVQALKLSYA